MLRIYFLISFIITAIHGAGEFTVLHLPESIDFHGEEAIESEFIGDILYTAMGFDITDEYRWSGLIIKDPFNLVKNVIAIYVEGLPSLKPKLNTRRTYDINGLNAYESLRALSDELTQSERMNSVSEIDFEDEHTKAVNDFKFFFDYDDYDATSETILLQPNATSYLNASRYLADLEFLEQIFYLNATSDKLVDILKSTNFLLIRLTVENIIATHNKQNPNEILNEASGLIAGAMERLQTAIETYKDSALLVQLTTNEASYSDLHRYKRLNLFKFKQHNIKFKTLYQDMNLSSSVKLRVAPKVVERKLVYTSKTGFTVIIANNTAGKRIRNLNFTNSAQFNDDAESFCFVAAILTMIALMMALLAVSYAIIDMDPGRDSIVYRMSVPRLKKNN